VQDRQLQEKIAVVGSVLPSQARSLILDGAIREGFSWNPVNAGYAMVSLAKLVLDGVDVRQGVEISGLGPATVDPDRRHVKFDKVLRANKATVDDLIALGL
jgi:simple sugar transport system substrate-binding protein